MLINRVSKDAFMSGSDYPTLVELGSRIKIMANTNTKQLPIISNLCFGNKKASSKRQSILPYRLVNMLAWA